MDFNLHSRYDTVFLQWGEQPAGPDDCGAKVRPWNSRGADLVHCVRRVDAAWVLVDSVARRTAKLWISMRTGVAHLAQPDSCGSGELWQWEYKR